MSDEKLGNIIEFMEELQEDGSMPKNIKAKLASTVTILKTKEELSLRVDKALHELDEVANDSNIEAFNRTQLWNVVSMLESL